ncbi:hypothetical protein Tco_1442590, partial [Tanacetum coccineum]
MPKSNNDKKNTNAFKRTTQISVRACCFVNPPLASPPYQYFSPHIDYQSALPSTPIELLPTFLIDPLGFFPGYLLNTPNTTPPLLTSLPPIPSQPSKQNSPLAINLPVEFIFSTPPISPHQFFISLEDLPPQTTNPP